MTRRNKSRKKKVSSDKRAQPGRHVHGSASPLNESREQYKTVFDIADPAEVSNHLSLVVEKLRHRARSLAWVNICLLFMIVATVTACIVIFWYSDAIVTDFVGQKLRGAVEQRSSLKREIYELELKVPTAEREVLLLESAEKGLLPLTILFSDVESFRNDFGDATATSTEDEEFRDKLTKRLNFLLGRQMFDESRKVFNAIRTDAEKVSLRYRGEFTLNSPMLLKLKQVAQSSGLIADEVVKSVDAFRNAFIELRKEVNSGGDVTPLITTVSKVYSGLQKPVKDTLTKIGEDKQAAMDESVSLGSEPILQRIQELRIDLEKLNEEIGSLELEQASIGSFAWVPSLSVRVGSVVLALFLTQFFVSMYRYNTMTASFYASRADILQLVGKDSLGTWINLKDLTALVAGLSPDSLDFQSPESPVRPFVDIFRNSKA